MLYVGRVVPFCLILCIILLKALAQGPSSVSPSEEFVVRLVTSRYSGFEGNALQIGVTVIGTITRRINVQLVVIPYTASSNRDYLSPRMKTITVTPDMQLPVFVTIYLVNDHLWEPTERFGVVLKGPRSFIGEPNMAIATIFDDDVLKVKLDFSESNLILPESVGNVSLRATTMSPFSDPLMLFVICRQLYQFETPAMGFERDSNSSNASDFHGIIHPIYFQTPQTRPRHVSYTTTSILSIVDDHLTECTECFTCRLAVPYGTRAVILEEPSEVNILIQDNDVLNVKFSESLYVGEEDSVIEIVVEATNDFMDPFTVLVMPYSYQSGDPYKENEAKEGINFQLPNNLSEITFHPELGRRYSYRITLLNSSEVDKYFGLSLMPFFNASCDNQMLVEEEDRTDVCISGNSKLLYIGFNQSVYRISRNDKSVTLFFGLYRNKCGKLVPTENDYKNFRIKLKLNPSSAGTFGQTSEAGNDYSNRFRFTVGNQYNTAEITLKSPPVDSFTVQIYRYFAIRDVVKPYPNRISTRVVMS